MHLCDSDHEQICHGSFKCPLCDALGRVADLENDLEDARERIDKLETGELD